MKCKLCGFTKYEWEPDFESPQDAVLDHLILNHKGEFEAFLLKEFVIVE